MRIPEVHQHITIHTARVQHIIEVQVQTQIQEHIPLLHRGVAIITAIAVTGAVVRLEAAVVQPELPGVRERQLDLEVQEAPGVRERQLDPEAQEAPGVQGRQLGQEAQEALEVQEVHLHQDGDNYSQLNELY